MNGSFNMRFGLVLMLALCAGHARAGSVSPMTVEDLADHAGQVVIGRIAGVRSYWADQPRRIESEITLENTEYFKGALSHAERGSTFTIPGGAVDGFEMRLGCAPVFRVGEKWLLFLLPTYQTFPVVGISKGALRVIPGADGIERLYDPSGAAVVGIDEQGFIRTAPAASPSAVTHLREAHSARVADAAERDAPAGAIALAEFVARIRPILDSSRDHALTAPAGRRAHQAAPPVPLRAVTEQAAPPPSPRGLDAVEPAADASGRTYPLNQESNE